MGGRWTIGDSCRPWRWNAWLHWWWQNSKDCAGFVGEGKRWWVSSGGGGREGHYCVQHHGAGQEGQQHCGGPGAAEIAAMMNVVMGGGQHRADSLSNFGGGQHHGAGHGCQQQCGGSLALIGDGQNWSAGGGGIWQQGAGLPADLEDPVGLVGLDRYPHCADCVRTVELPPLTEEGDEPVEGAWLCIGGFRGGSLMPMVFSAKGLKRWGLFGCQQKCWNWGTKRGGVRVSVGPCSTVEPLAFFGLRCRRKNMQVEGLFV